jgi:hypothetical protein
MNASLKSPKLHGSVADNHPCEADGDGDLHRFKREDDAA